MRSKMLLPVLGVLLFSSAVASAQSTVDRPQATIEEKSTPVSPHKADRYNFLDKKIIKVLKSGIIPEEFPEFDKQTMTAESYEAICRKWLKEHPALVKEEYLERLK